MADRYSSSRAPSNYDPRNYDSRDVRGPPPPSYDSRSYNQGKPDPYSHVKTEPKAAVSNYEYDSRLPQYGLQQQQISTPVSTKEYPKNMTSTKPGQYEASPFTFTSSASASAAPPLNLADGINRLKQVVMDMEIKKNGSLLHSDIMFVDDVRNVKDLLYVIEVIRGKYRNGRRLDFLWILNKNSGIFIHPDVNFILNEISLLGYHGILSISSFDFELVGKKNTGFRITFKNEAPALPPPVPLSAPISSPVVVDNRPPIKTSAYREAEMKAIRKDDICTLFVSNWDFLDSKLEALIAKYGKIVEFKKQASKKGGEPYFLVDMDNIRHAENVIHNLHNLLVQGASRKLVVQINTKGPDWVCVCGFLNFGSRESNVCVKCRQPKVEDPKTRPVENVRPHENIRPMEIDRDPRGHPVDVRGSFYNDHSYSDSNAYIDRDHVPRSGDRIVRLSRSRSRSFDRSSRRRSRSMERGRRRSSRSRSFDRGSRRRSISRSVDRRKRSRSRSFDRGSRRRTRSRSPPRREYLPINNNMNVNNNMMMMNNNNNMNNRPLNVNKNVGIIPHAHLQSMPMNNMKNTFQDTLHVRGWSGTSLSLYQLFSEYSKVKGLRMGRNYFLVTFENEKDADIVSNKFQNKFIAGYCNSALFIKRSQIAVDEEWQFDWLCLACGISNHARNKTTKCFGCSAVKIEGAPIPKGSFGNIFDTVSPTKPIEKEVAKPVAVSAPVVVEKNNNTNNTIITSNNKDNKMEILEEKETKAEIVKNISSSIVEETLTIESNLLENNNLVAVENENMNVNDEPTITKNDQEQNNIVSPTKSIVAVVKEDDKHVLDTHAKIEVVHAVEEGVKNETLSSEDKIKEIEVQEK